jgi:hypothetical protein
MRGSCIPVIPSHPACLTLPPGVLLAPRLPQLPLLGSLTLQHGVAKHSSSTAAGWAVRHTTALRRGVGAGAGAVRVAVQHRSAGAGPALMTWELSRAGERQQGAGVVGGRAATLMQKLGRGSSSSDGGSSKISSRSAWEGRGGEESDNAEEGEGTGGGGSGSGSGSNGRGAGGAMRLPQLRVRHSLMLPSSGSDLQCQWRQVWSRRLRTSVAFKGSQSQANLQAHFRVLPELQASCNASVQGPRGGGGSVEWKAGGVKLALRNGRSKAQRQVVRLAWSFSQAGPAWQVGLRRGKGGRGAEEAYSEFGLRFQPGGQVIELDLKLHVPI